MSAVTYNLVLEAGCSYSITVTWKDSTGTPINLAGYTAKLQIRNGPGDAVLLEKSSGAASITLGGAAGTIAWTITGAEATTLSAQLVPMKWDLLMTSPTSIGVRLLQGLVTASPAITV